MKRGEYLATLINRNKWSIGAELGVWDGRTLKHLLAETPAHIIAVDAWVEQGEYVGRDRFGNIWDHEAHKKAVYALSDQYPGRVTIYCEMTVDAARRVKDGSLDFIFIDADHSYEGVLADIDAWSCKVRPGGLILGHDINWKSVKAAVDERFPEGYFIGPDNVWLVTP